MLDIIKNYLLQDWALVLVLAAFVIMLTTSVFVDKKTTNRTLILIIIVFVLSITVFLEFYFEAQNKYKNLRLAFMSIRYSSVPLIMAYIIFTLIKKQRFYIFIPAFVLLCVDIISIFTGIVFSISEENTLKRGVLGFIPYIMVGFYAVILIYLLVARSNKRKMEIIPIIFLSLSFASGLIFPFIFGKDFSQMFCTTIAISLFSYYVFQIMTQTKKDPLTGLLNRLAYYADIQTDAKEITSIISLDMDGLKATNDTFGHTAGDEALISLGICFLKATKAKQSAYRIGGDEFIIICRRCSKEEIDQLIDRINKLVSETPYSCSIGYSYSDDGSKTIDQLVKESDDMMYKAKAKHYDDLKTNI